MTRNSKPAFARWRRRFGCSLRRVKRSTSAASRRRCGTRTEQENLARGCLLARRLVERGVRFVQLSLGGWDHHAKINDELKKKCGEIDRPIAALLKDLRQRGLLDDTLVIWGGEFGRTPVSENGDGRDHNHYGFTMWMAGGGVKGGISHGRRTNLASRRRRTGQRPRSARDYSALARTGPREADVPLQRSAISG